MLTELPVFQMATALARHASTRHRVISENVANADTPGFRARDVEAFSHRVNQSFTPRATRPGHIGAIQTNFRSPDSIIDRTTSPSLNGNSVSLEAEMIKAAETRGQHAMAQAIYRKAHELLRLSIGRGR